MDVVIAKQIQNEFNKKGYIFETYPYKLNVIGVRTSNYHTNKFDDFLYVVYRSIGNMWTIKQYPITTDPGTLSLISPINGKGTAILVPGQYKDSYAIDKHNGKYEALCQRLGPVKVYRDSNRDKSYDLVNIDEGYFGINLHKAGESSIVVNNWSAGCQVFKNEKDFNEFMNICKVHEEMHGNKFTYTLFNRSDFT